MSKMREENKMLYTKKPKYLHAKQKRKLPFTAVISYLLIAVVLTAGVSFSRYSTSASSSDSARVAKYVFEVAYTNSTDAVSFPLEDLNAPGTTEDIVFVVSNKSGDDLCEVLQEYEIEWTTTGNLPLNFELTGTLDNGGGDEYNGTLYQIFDDKPAQKGALPPAEEAVHTYTLKVTWDKEEDSPHYAGEVDQIKIIVNARQIEGN